MALHEHDREDLLGEARNMPLRGQCTMDGVVVVVGFRDRGQVSLFCGVDPVFQFNSRNELRRAYFGSCRYRAENGRLVELTRERRGGRVAFETAPAANALVEELMESLRSWIDRIRDAAETGSWQVVGEPVEQFRSRLQTWLTEVDGQPRIAASPNA